MAFPSIQDLLESGVHFGHQTRRWNPKMKKFIFAERNGIHIIDLKKTLNHLQKASDRVRDIAEKGGNILFVGTKKQLRDIIRDEALRCGMYYVNERWLGGMITNFQTIKKNIRRLRDLERMRDEGEFETRTKKEGLSLQRELLKLQRTLDGIKLLSDIPDAIFVVDAQKEKIAVSEANKIGIPLIALIDTNADPEKINFPVAGNDDAIRSVKLITQTIADAVLDGKAKYTERLELDKQTRETAAAQSEERREEAGAARSGQDQPKRTRPRRRHGKKRPFEEMTGQGAARPPRPVEKKAAEEPAAAAEPAKIAEKPETARRDHPAAGKSAGHGGEVKTGKDSKEPAKEQPAKAAIPAVKSAAKPSADEGKKAESTEEKTSAPTRRQGEKSGAKSREKASE